MPTAGLPGDLVLAFVLLDLVVIVVAARLLGGLFRRYGHPTVVGEILAGVLLGPTLLGPKLFAWDRPWKALHCDAALSVTNGVPSIGSCLFPPQARSVLGIIGQIALILYMFIVGVDLDHSMLKGRARGMASVAVTATLLPVAVGLLIAPLLYDAKFVGGFGTDAQPSRLAFGLMVAAMLAVTAFPVMAHILQEKGLSRSAMGSIGIAATAVLSILMFLVLATAVLVARDATIAEIVERWVIAGAFVGVMLFVVRPALAPLGRRIEAAGTLSPNQFAVVLVLALAAGYVADRVAINVIPGAFLAGAVLPARDIVRREVFLRIRDLTMVVLLPVFLAFSGLNTDFTQLGLVHVAGVLLFLAAGIASKWVGGAVGARAGGLTWARQTEGLGSTDRGQTEDVRSAVEVWKKLVRNPCDVNEAGTEGFTSPGRHPSTHEALADDDQGRVHGAHRFDQDVHTFVIPETSDEEDDGSRSPTRAECSRMFGRIGCEPLGVDPEWDDSDQVRSLRRDAREDG
jgi:Kef-type K+ transport system membrane component KefB